MIIGTDGQYGFDPTETSYDPPMQSMESEPSLWGQVQSSIPTMDPKRKKILDAMLMKMATPNFQHPPAFQPSDPFRYYPQQ